MTTVQQPIWYNSSQDYIQDLDFTAPSIVQSPMASTLAAFDPKKGPVMYNGIGFVQANNPYTQNLFGQLIDTGYNMDNEPALVNAAQGVGEALQSLFG